MKPILKYGGGKSKEIPHYLNLIPKFETYYEPFLGGGATYFYLEPKKAFVSDINSNLIDFYDEISSDNFSLVKQELLELQNKYESNRRVFMERKQKSPEDRVLDPNEELYYSIRDMFNNKIENKYSRAAIYYFINKTAYSGMIRYNSLGEFNVPYGRYANFNTTLLNTEHHDLLRQTEIHKGSYEKGFELAGPKDFIF